MTEGNWQVVIKPLMTTGFVPLPALMDPEGWPQKVSGKYLLQISLFRGKKS